MQKRLHALAMAAMLLFTVIGISSHTLSASIDLADNQGAQVSPSSGLHGDTVIQFPDPSFEAAVREAIGKPEGSITVGDVAGVTYLNISAYQSTIS